MLNRTEGELLPVLGRGKVVPTEKWAHVLDMLDIASHAAAEEFGKKGASRPIKFYADNILVQEYHVHSLIIFIFWMKINGQDYYYWYKFNFAPEFIGELVVANLWPAIYLPGLQQTVQ